MEFGDFEIHLLSDGQFRLDGGAMFGAVPKAVWQRSRPADERNRILVGLNCLLITRGAEAILVDTGLGVGWDRKFLDLYALDRSGSDLVRALAGCGLQPSSVTRVVLTHLHFDHAGGNCLRQEGAPARPAFPNATYYADAGELAVARRPDPRSRASYLPHTWEPLERSGQLVLTSGGQSIVDGVELVPAPGHTRHHQCVLVRSGGRAALFLADLVPTLSHLKVHYVMGYDLEPLRTMETKERLLAQARREQWLLLFQHEPEPAAGYLTGTEGQIELVDLRRPVAARRQSAAA